MTKPARFLILTGLLLLAAALSLTAYNLWDDARADRAADAARSTLSTAIKARVPSSSTPENPERSAESSAVPSYQLNPEIPMPTETVDGLDYIGLLEIPALELSLPVLSQWSYGSLKTAPCRYSGSAYLGDLVIAAHNYSGHFGTLRSAAVGDEVRFTDVEGNTFRYAVAELEVLRPADLAEMTDSGYDLTLFTCTVGGQARLTVRCTRLES